MYEVRELAKKFRGWFKLVQGDAIGRSGIGSNITGTWCYMRVKLAWLN